MHSSRAVVDKFMSEDIEHFLEAESRSKDRLGRRDGAPRVLPSPSPEVISGRQLHAPWGRHPSNSLVPASDHETRVGKSSTVSLRADMDWPSFLRYSLAPDPPVYTGSAELRGDITIIPQEVRHCCYAQHDLPTRQEPLSASNLPYRRFVTSEVYVVIATMRPGLYQLAFDFAASR